MKEFLYDRLMINLRELKMIRTIEILDNYVERVNKEKTSFIEALDYLLREEKIYRDDTSLSMRTNVAGFPYRKTFEEFNFSFQPSIDMKMINDLRTCRYIENIENVVLLGSPGVGKTHLAVALGMDALRNKYSTYYINCHDLISSLNKAQFENTLHLRMKTLVRYRVLIIDEVGYLPIDRQGANLFFQLISKRYEQKTTILTSNKSFSEWDSIFGDRMTAAAILDRLLHHATVINIKGDSYRLRERKEFMKQAKKD